MDLYRAAFSRTRRCGMLQIKVTSKDDVIPYASCQRGMIVARLFYVIPFYLNASRGGGIVKLVGSVSSVCHGNGLMNVNAITVEPLDWRTH